MRTILHVLRCVLGLLGGCASPLSPARVVCERVDRESIGWDVRAHATSPPPLPSNEAAMREATRDFSAVHDDIERAIRLRRGAIAVGVLDAALIFGTALSPRLPSLSKLPSSGIFGLQSATGGAANAANATPAEPASSARLRAASPMFPILLGVVGAVGAVGMRLEASKKMSGAINRYSRSVASDRCYPVPQ